MSAPRGRYRRASEIGEWYYCHRAWWLHHVRGFEPANRGALRRGVAAHAAHGAAVGRAAWLRRVALLLLLAALALLALGWWLG